MKKKSEEKKVMKLSEIQIKIVKELLEKAEGDFILPDGSKKWNVFIDNCNLQKIGLTKRQWSGYLSGLAKMGLYEWELNGEGKRDSAFGYVKEIPELGLVKKLKK